MGKRNLVATLADLRLDLKDSGSVWSDPELTRCIDKAVSDLSRFLPREKIYEETIDYAVSAELFTTPAAEDDDWIVDAWSMNNEVAGATVTIANHFLDVPRPVKVTLTDANNSVNQMTLIVKGTDKDGNYVEESFYLHGGKVQTGKQYFYHIIQVELDQVGGNGPGDTIDVGSGTNVGVYVSLANKPIRPRAITLTSSPAGTTYALDTDFIMDYANGRVAIKSGGSMAAATAYLITYEKSRISIDLNDLPGFIKVNRVEHPGDNVPQTHESSDLFGNILTLTGSGDENQKEVTDKQHVVVQYFASHTPPSNIAAGSYPDFLDNTVILAASAYALFIEALQYEFAAVTDLASVRTALTSLAAVHTLAAAALAKVITYLESNSSEDSKFWLTKITTDIAGLRTAIGTALDAANTYLDEVDTTDLQGAEGVWADEVKHILTEAGIPNAEDFLELGDDFIQTVNVAADVGEGYRRYADTALEMAKAWAQKRADFLTEASARTNAAMGFVQEAIQRLSNLRTYIEQATGWGRIAETFVAEASGRIAEMDRYLSEAAQYGAAANTDLQLSDRLREQAVERRNEAWSIWRSPDQLGADLTSSSARQPGRYNG